MKRLFSLVGAVSVVLALSACSMSYESSSVEPPPPVDTQDSENTLDMLQQANEIVLQKAAVSFNDSYLVTADEVELGKIQGQYVYLLGDTFSFFTKNGNLVASEGEDYKFITHGATFFNYNNERTGGIKERFSMFLRNWDIVDVEGNVLGEANQRLGFTMSYDVKNATGDVEYTITKSIFSIGSKIAITRVSNEPRIDPMTAIWIAAVGNELDEADEENDNE